MKKFLLFLSNLKTSIGTFLKNRWAWITTQWKKPGAAGQPNTFQLAARIFGIWGFLMFVLRMVKPEWFNTWFQCFNLFILLPFIFVMLMIALTPSGRPRGYRIVAGFMVAVIAEVYFGEALVKLFPGISSMWEQIHVAGVPTTPVEMPSKYLVLAPGETGTITIDRGYSFDSKCLENGEIIYPKHIPCGPGVSEPLGDSVAMITYQAGNTPLHVVVSLTKVW